MSKEYLKTLIWGSDISTVQWLTLEPLVAGNTRIYGSVK